MLSPKYPYVAFYGKLPIHEYLFKPIYIGFSSHFSLKLPPSKYKIPKQMNLYIATSRDPFYNLAVENWLFREILTDTPILYLWQNSPCVVIGRAQNPWRECNIDALNKDRIPIVRRQSGGGTVYHDLGNLNYTIMAKSEDYNKQANLALIIDILRCCGINAHASPHNDILVTYKNTDYKISGSAFRETRDKSFHHGTLLINADTSKLYNYLHHTIDDSLTSKGVPSNRSKVINLSEINTQTTIAIIKNAFLHQFQQQITYLPDNLSHPLIVKEQKTLRTWQWRFGKTLPFSRRFVFNNISFSLEVKNGQLVELNTYDQNHYMKLTHWIKEVTPYYTRSSFNKAPLYFTTQEKALLAYLYKHTAEVTGESECNDHSIMG